MPIIKQINNLIVFENRIEKCIEVRTLSGKCVEVFAFEDTQKAIDFATDCKDFLGVKSDEKS